MPIQGEIGVGFLGISHPHSSARYRSASALPGVTIKGAYDRDPEALQAFCEEVGATPLTLEEMLEDPEISAVFVHSKSNLMSPLAVQALSAGKHVLVEKPGGASLNDLRRLSEYESHSSLVVRVGYNFHFSPALGLAHKYIREAKIGRISLVRGHGASSRGEHLSAHLNQSDDMGGALWVIGCHVLHLIIDILGAPIAVRATVRKYPSWSGPNSREDVASLTLEYEDKLATFDFTVHDSSEWFESSEVAVYGDKGHLSLGVLPGRLDALVLDPSEPAVGWTSWKEGSFATPWTGPTSRYSELPQVGNSFFFDREVSEFLHAVAGQETGGGVTALTAFHVAAVVAAAYKSDEMNGVSVAVASV